MLNVCCRVERRGPLFPGGGGSKGRWNCGYGSIGSNLVPGEQRLYVADGLHLFGCSELYTETMGVFLEQMEQGGRECRSRKEKRELLVGSRDIPLFYARVLEGMEALGILQSPEIDWEKYRPEALKAGLSLTVIRRTSCVCVRRFPTEILRFRRWRTSMFRGRSAGCTGGILYQPPDHAVLLLLGG